MFYNRPPQISKASYDKIRACSLHEGEWGKRGIIEGDLLKNFKSFVFKSQVSPKSQGCILHWTLEYEKLHEGIPNPETMLQFVIQICKDMDSHIIQGN
ncbi:hypothetical protein V6Z11_A01G168600 [Gossypium hirsutum]